jgi:hypothetical protein
MKVYIITKGDYSDYHICAVTTDKKKAEMLRKAYNDLDGWRKARIETYDTDTFLTEIENGLKLYNCTMEHNKPMVIHEVDLDYMNSHDFNVRYKHYTYWVYVWAKDEEHALKIASDKIAEYKANKEGI